MKFGPVPVEQAKGLILAHTFRGKGLTLKKGHVVAADDIKAMKEAGVCEVVGARLERGDVSENEAASEIAKFLAGPKVELSPARTGRCNLVAAADGVVLVNASLIDSVNMISEVVTVATLPDKSAAKCGQTVATVKIIPFAIPADVMAAVKSTLDKPAVGLEPYAPRRFALISTLLPGLKSSVVESTAKITRQRVESVRGELISIETCAHNTPEVSERITAALHAGAEVVLISGASATSDRADVIPAGIVAAGGTIAHFGMPVDPGNLLVLAHVNRAPVLVMPGCARSPKLNGLDWVMQRLAAGFAVGAKDIMRLGAGGLLVDIPSRPLPRESAVQPEAKARAPRVAAVVLAGGQSRRMEGANKLLMDVDGKPLIYRCVAAIGKAGIAPVIVVTGHMAGEVRQALSGQDVRFVHNPRYAEGLSTSLKAGIEALPREAEGALVCLGDMPAVAVEHLQALLKRFDPEGGNAIVVPTHRGKRGNPVLWARRFFADMCSVSGDVGARHLIGDNESLVYEVEFEDTGVLTDLDTPAQWSKYLARSSEAV